MAKLCKSTNEMKKETTELHIKLCSNCYNGKMVVKLRHFTQIYGFVCLDKWQAEEEKVNRHRHIAYVYSSSIDDDLDLECWYAKVKKWKRLKKKRFAFSFSLCFVFVHVLPFFFLPFLSVLCAKSFAQNVEQNYHLFRFWWNLHEFNFFEFHFRCVVVCVLLGMDGYFKVHIFPFSLNENDEC